MANAEAPSSPITQIMFAKEAAWGTAVTAGKDLGLIVTDSAVTWDREVMESLGLGNIETQKITTGVFDPKMTITGEFQHGRILEFVAGTASHSTVSSDEVHTFTITDTAPSASISSAVNMATDIDLTSAGMLLESCEISSEINGKVMLNTSWVGKTVAKDTSAPAFTQSTLPVFPHAFVSVGIGSGTASICQSASITFNKTIERAGGLGSNLYQQGAATEFKVEFAATLGFTDDTYHDLFLGSDTPAGTADPAATVFRLVADNNVAQGSGQRYMTVGLANCQMKGLNQPTTVGGLTFVEITGHGTLSEMITVDDIDAANW